MTIEISTPIVYPSALPMPQAAPIQSAERRARSPRGEGPYEVRTLQRDRLGLQSVIFPPMNAVQTATFEAWWRETLIFGGARFEATWPLPWGTVPWVRRFASEPHYEFIPTVQGNFWRISADFEVFGASETPVLIEEAPAIYGYLLHFDGIANPAAFPDEVGNTWARVAVGVGQSGNIVVQDQHPKFGAGSLKVYTRGGSLDDNTLQTTALVNGPYFLDSGNKFTLSGWLYWSGNVDSRPGLGAVLVKTGGIGTEFVLAEIRMWSTNQFTFNTNLGGVDDKRQVSIPANTPTYLELGYDGATKYWSVNGVMQGSAAVPAGAAVQVTKYRIQGIPSGNPGSPAAYLDECAFELNVCRHTEDFDPPTAPYFVTP